MRRLTYTIQDVSLPSFSPDAKWMICSMGKCLLQRSPTNPQPLLLLTAAQAPVSGQYSPNGEFVLVTEYDSRQTVQVYGSFTKRTLDYLRSFAQNILLVTPDGKDTRTIGRGRSPRFSPDGRTIAYSVYDENDGPCVYLMNLAGKQKRYIGKGEDPIYSPDGKLLLYSRWDGKTQVLELATLEGDNQGKQYQLHDRWGIDGCFTTDSSSVIVTSGLDGDTTIRKTDFTSPKPIRFQYHNPGCVNIRGMRANPCVSPDGKQLALYGGDNLIIGDLENNIANVQLMHLYGIRFSSAGQPVSLFAGQCIP